MTSVLQLVGLSATYGSRPVLHAIDLALEAGTIVALLGPNGAGKTTTFRAIAGALVTVGEVLVDGKRLVRRSPEAIARLGIAHVPEGRGTLADFTVRENLALGAYTIGSRARRAAACARVLDYFPTLSTRGEQRAGTLSGGEQQMLAIGRALMMEPRVLLLDEPSLGLAPLVVRDIFALLRRINRDDGVAILVAEQNAEIALRTASYAYVLEAGRIALAGPAQRLRGDRAVRASYLGETGAAGTTSVSEC
ncbi:MAG: ABC transporter ATP-binding protein [Vulcanimicrobiaceae bacterium]